MHLLGGCSLEKDAQRRDMLRVFRQLEDAFWGEGTVCSPDLQLGREVIGLNCGS